MPVEVKEAKPPVLGIGIGEIGHNHLEIVTRLGDPQLDDDVRRIPAELPVGSCCNFECVKETSICWYRLSARHDGRRLRFYNVRPNSPKEGALRR